MGIVNNQATLDKIEDLRNSLLVFFGWRVEYIGIHFPA